MPLRKALIADDHGMYRLGLGLTLKDRLGFDAVVEAETLDEALDRLGADDAIGLALFDLSMPGMEGAASLAGLREVHPDLTIAVVSGSEDRADILAAIDAGANGFIPKRLGDEALVAALSAVLAGQIFVPSSVASLVRSAGTAASPLIDVDLPARLNRLTPRQRDVLRLVVGGRSNKEIARALGLGEGTVKIHLAALFRHLDVKNRAQAAAVAAGALASFKP